MRGAVLAVFGPSPPSSRTNLWSLLTRNWRTMVNTSNEPNSNSTSIISYVDLDSESSHGVRMADVLTINY